MKKENYTNDELQEIGPKPPLAERTTEITGGTYGPRKKWRNVPPKK
jgi:hypothetical protein